MSKPAKITSTSVAPPTASRQHPEQQPRELQKRHGGNPRSNQTLGSSRDCGVTSYSKMPGNRRTTADTPPPMSEIPYYFKNFDTRPDHDPGRFASMKAQTEEEKLNHFPSEEGVSLASLKDTN